jgi:hypothetical protein
VQRQSILAELGWLVYFIALLVVAVYAMNVFVNGAFPRHFNDTVADVIAGIFAAIAFVATRAYVTRRRT